MNLLMVQLGTDPLWMLMVFLADAKMFASALCPSVICSGGH